jgi:ferritin-like metal-binding protein YciE
MAEEFKIIETQEQLDAVIKGRLEREREKSSTQLAELQAKLDKQTAETQKQISELTQALNAAKEEKNGFDKLMEEKDATIKKYELHSVKTQIAHELGLSFEAVNFLQGSTEEEIRTSAESLKDLVGTKTAPLAAEVPVASSEKDAKNVALRSMVRDLTK